MGRACAHPAGAAARDHARSACRSTRRSASPRASTRTSRALRGARTRSGFGHVEVGTVTAIPQDGNPRPRLFRLIPDRAVVNRMGFNNHGAEAAAARLRTAAPTRAAHACSASTSARAASSTSRTRPPTTCASATLLAPLADYLVVNVSSPNTPGLRGLQAVETLAAAAGGGASRRRARTPLLVKIAPDLPDDEVVAIAQLAVDAGLAGIIATNTTISRDGLDHRPGRRRRRGRRRPVGRTAEGACARGAAAAARDGSRRTSASSRSAGSRRRKTCGSGWMPEPPSCRATRRSSTAARCGPVRSTAGWPSGADADPCRAARGGAGVRPGTGRA